MCLSFTCSDCDVGVDLMSISLPLKIQIYSEVSFSGEGRVFHTDTESTAGMVFLHGASVRVARGW